VLCTTAVKESEKRKRPGRGHRVMAKQSQDKLLSLALLLAELIIYNYLSAALFFLDFNYSG